MHYAVSFARRSAQLKMQYDENEHKQKLFSNEALYGYDARGCALRDVGTARSRAAAASPLVKRTPRRQPPGGRTQQWVKGWVGRIGRGRGDPGRSVLPEESSGHLLVWGQGSVCSVLGERGKRVCRYPVLFYCSLLLTDGVRGPLSRAVP